MANGEFGQKRSSIAEYFSLKGDTVATLERSVDYLIGDVDGEISVHVGRGYIKENGGYKPTLRVPVEASNITDVLYEQLQQFDLIFAIDSNKIVIEDREFVGSCAVHVSLEYAGNNVWKNGTFTRLPAIISIPTELNPEPQAWKRLIEHLLPLVSAKVAIVVDSELGDLPLFNSRKLPICGSFFLPENVQLIYASSERDSASPLNRAIKICDADASRILKILAKNFKAEHLTRKILDSPHGVISLQPVR